MEVSLDARALVVDDSRTVRVRVRRLLEDTEDFNFEVSEAADGSEALKLLEKTSIDRLPDVILLDIGLPTLNGLEAANRIRQVAPDAKIIFLTQNSDRDVVRAALSTGARGYVLKTDAGGELYPAMVGVLDSDNFVSSGIQWGDSGETENT